ncbi:MAG: DUF4129 domain-containing protein [Armatimonadota bacterium]
MHHYYRKTGCRAIAAVVLILGSTVIAQAITVEAYRSLIVECRKELQKETVSEDRRQSLRSRLSAVQTVTYEDGHSVEVNTRPLIASLSGFPSSTASARFAVLERLLTTSGMGKSKADPRAQAEQILLTSEFAELRRPVKNQPDVVPNWWTRFIRWLKATGERFAKWLRDLLRDRSTPDAPDAAGVKALVTFLQFLLYFVLGAAALVALYLLARAGAAGGWLSALRRKRKRGSDSALDLDLSGDGIADPLGAARALAAKGAYRDAIRMAYIASLRRLQENGLLILEPNKTNWEYQRDLRRRSPSTADALLPATRLFDRVWYGRREGTAEEFSEAVQVHDNLEVVKDMPIVDPELSPADAEGARP